MSTAVFLRVHLQDDHGEEEEFMVRAPAAPIARRKCSMSTAVFFTSDEYTSEPTMRQKGTLLPSSCATPSASAVFPLPGAPACARPRVSRLPARVTRLPAVRAPRPTPAAPRWRWARTRGDSGAEPRWARRAACLSGGTSRCA